MRQIRKTLGWPMTFGLVALVGAMVAPTFALRSTAPPRPPVICHVDLQQVFNDSKWRADAKVEIENLTTAAKDETEAQRSIVTELSEDLDIFVKGTPQYEAKKAEVIEALARLEALIDFHESKHDVRRAALRTEIYERIVIATAAFAKQNGIDYVITDDTVVDLQPVTELQVVQQMSLQRMVYANPDYDVTQQLIGFIN